MANFGQYVVDAFSSLTPDINGVYRDAKTYHLSDWKALQKTLVTGSGAAAVAIPGLHLLGIAADVAFLMNRMAVCSYGIGAIIGSDEGEGNILEEEDFAIILAGWGGDESVNDAALAKAAADLTGKVGGKMVSKQLAAFMTQRAGILIGKKLGGKAAAGFIPFLGAAVGGG